MRKRNVKLWTDDVINHEKEKCEALDRWCNKSWEIEMWSSGRVLQAYWSHHVSWGPYLHLSDDLLLQWRGLLLGRGRGGLFSRLCRAGFAIALLLTRLLLLLIGLRRGVSLLWLCGFSFGVSVDFSLCFSLVSGITFAISLPALSRLLCLPGVSSVFLRLLRRCGGRLRCLLFGCRVRTRAAVRFLARRHDVLNSHVDAVLNNAHH